MQFKTNKLVASVSGNKRPSLEKYCSMLEQCYHDRMTAFKDEAFEVDHNLLSVATSKSTKAALISLSCEDRQNLADAFGCQLKDLATMSTESFRDKCISLMSSDAEPANESIIVTVATIYAIYCIMLFALIGLSTDVSGVDYRSIYRQLDIAFKGREKEALDEIVVHGWKESEVSKMLTACDKIILFLKQNMTTVFSDKFKLSDIEKLGANLWTSSLEYTDAKNKLWWAHGRKIFLTQLAVR